MDYEFYARVNFEDYDNNKELVERKAIHALIDFIPLEELKQIINFKVLDPRVKKTLDNKLGYLEYLEQVEINCDIEIKSL